MSMKILEGSGGMPCPECGERSKVTNSRPAVVMETAAIYRRRECLTCKHRWSAFEVAADLLESLVEDAS